MYKQAGELEPHVLAPWRWSLKQELEPRPKPLKEKPALKRRAGANKDIYTYTSGLVKISWTKSQKVLCKKDIDYVLRYIVQMFLNWLE